MLSRTLPRLLGPAQRLCSTPNAPVHKGSMRQHLILSRDTPRYQQVPMLLEELKQMHGVSDMVKIIKGFVPEVQSSLRTTILSSGPEARDAKQAWKQLRRLKPDEPNAEKYFLIFAVLVSTESAVQREILARGGRLSVPHAQLQHDNLLACAQHVFDSDNRLSFDSGPERTKTEMWLAWEWLHLGKMQGQAMELYRRTRLPTAVPNKDPVKETEKLYGILDGALGEERNYLAGSGAGKFSMADIAVFAWVNVAYYSGIDLERFPNIQKWWKRILERPAIQYLLERVKIRVKYNTEFLEAMRLHPDFRAQEEMRRKVYEERCGGQTRPPALNQQRADMDRT